MTTMRHPLHLLDRVVMLSMRKMVAPMKQALVIVPFEGLRDAGYLVANPMRSVMKGFKRPKTGWT